MMTTLTNTCIAQTEHAAIVEEAAKVTEIKADLDIAESKDPKKLEIVKQLRRLNPDGSYTVGFEAEDGTFKFESRDVLGNVKGTYGYVDANGEIKRVSYTAQNGTGIRGPGGSSLEETTAPTTPRINNKTSFVSSATTRRPTSLAYLTSSTASPTRSSVIQPIPRKRLIVPYPSEKSQNAYYSSHKNFESQSNPETTTVVYATSLPNGKTQYLIRPTQHPQSSIKTQEQIARPDKLEIDHVSNVKITSNRETSTSKPVVEEIDEKEPERKPNRGNHLRRQLSQEQHTTPVRETEGQFETQQHIIYSQADDEGGHIYGGANGVTRPIFTNPTTRIPAIVLAARHRATQLQTVINNSNNPTTTTTTSTQKPIEKIYNSPPNRHENSEAVYDPTTESSSEAPQSYLQTAGPVVQIPPNREIQSAADEESLILRRRPIPPYNSNHFRQEYPRQFRIPPPQRVGYRVPPSDRNGQYLKETSQNDQQYIDENTVIPANLPPFRQAKRAQNGRQYIQQQELEENSFEQQPYQLPIQQNPYRLPPYQSPLPYNNFPDRPLTTRDFERLLQILILRHQQQLQQSRFGYYGPPNPYGFGYPNSPYYGYQQIPRPPIYDPLYDFRSPYNRGPQSALRQFSDPEAAYQTQNQVPEQTTQYDNQRLIPRKKQFIPRYFGAQSAQYTNELDTPQQQDYLPSDVREDLLYRMLMLAIHGEAGGGAANGGGQQLQLPSTPEETIAPSESVSSQSRRDTQSPYSRKPVRSVQIIGEDF